MERGDILDGSCMIRQSTANDYILEDENEALKVLSDAFLSISENVEMQGETAKAFKQQMLDYKYLIDTAISANMADKIDNATAWYAFWDYYFDGDEILQNQKDALDEKERDEESKDYHYNEWWNSDDRLLGIFTESYHYWAYLYYSGCVNSDQREYDYWKLIEDNFDNINSSTSNLFTRTTNIRNAVIRGLEALARNYSSGNYQVDLNAQWREDLLKAFQDYCFDTDEFGNKTLNVSALYHKIENFDNMSVEEYSVYLGLLDSLTLDQKEEYVRIFEAYHEEYANNMNLFLKDLPTGSYVDVFNNNRTYHEDDINIRFIAYTAPEPERTLFLENAGDVLVDWNCECNPYWGWDETQKKLILHVDLSGYMDGTSQCTGGGAQDRRGPYVILFHEYGHYLDDILGDGKQNGDKFLTQEYNLTETIRQEVREDIESNLVLYCSNISPAITLSQDEIDTIVDAIAGPFTGADKTVGWTQDMKDAYNGLINAYNNNGGSDRNNIDWVPRNSVSVEYEGVTDVYTGITDNTFDYGYGHDRDNPNDPTEESYWYTPSGELKESVGKEFFAEAFSHTMTRSPKDQLEATESILGDSLEEYNQIIQDVSQ